MRKVLRRMCHAALRTPDLERSVWHATQVLGLREVERLDATVYLTSGAKHHDLQLIAAEATALDHFAIEALDGDALDEVHRRVVDEGLEVLSDEPEEPGLEHAVRFVTRDGQVVEVHDGMARDQPARYEGAGIRPRKFGHVTVGTPDTLGFEAFLERVLGFIPSDRVGDEIFWMRCNADHHGIAFAHAAEPGLRHIAWELESFADMVAAADHLHASGITLVWGPGRHGPGNNLAIYHVDPVGAIHECLFDLQQVEDDGWRGKDWDGIWNWRNLWGFGTESAAAAPDGAFPPIARPTSA